MGGVEDGLLGHGGAGQRKTHIIAAGQSETKRRKRT
jgi:hypothetical protein